MPTIGRRIVGRGVAFLKIFIVLMQAYKGDSRAKGVMSEGPIWHNHVLRHTSHLHRIIINIIIIIFIIIGRFSALWYDKVL